MAEVGSVAVVGGGLAAAKAVEALRDGGFGGRVVLFSAERHLPYERPPLSKGYLLGNDPLEQAFVHPQEWYDEHGVELQLGTPVTRIDLEHPVSLLGPAHHFTAFERDASEDAV